MQAEALSKVWEPGGAPTGLIRRREVAFELTAECRKKVVRVSLCSLFPRASAEGGAASPQGPSLQP